VRRIIGDLLRTRYQAPIERGGWQYNDDHEGDEFKPCGLAIIASMLLMMSYKNVFVIPVGL